MWHQTVFLSVGWYNRSWSSWGFCPPTFPGIPLLGHPPSWQHHQTSLTSPSLWKGFFTWLLGPPPPTPVLLLHLRLLLVSIHGEFLLLSLASHAPEVPGFGPLRIFSNATPLWSHPVTWGSISPICRWFPDSYHQLYPPSELQTHRATHLVSTYHLCVMV